MQISVNIVTRNDLRYLPDLFRSLAAQTYPELTIRVLDNGSTDGTLEYLQEHHSQLLVARNVRNLGAAAGYNQLIRFTLERLGESDLVERGILILHPDTILHERCLEELVAVFKRQPSLGAAQPKVLRAYTPDGQSEEVNQGVQSEVLDSTGLFLAKTWRITERGAGELDRGQYDTQLEIFGVSGACALWRASALKDSLCQGEAYDADFLSALMAADLALRASRRGVKTEFVPLAKVYHYLDLDPAIAARDHIFLLLKNLTWNDWFRSGWRVIPNAGLRFVHVLFKYPRLVLGMLRKRSVVHFTE